MAFSLSDLKQGVFTASNKYAKPSAFHPTYGTAGFRSDASLLDSTVFRCGLLVASRALNTGKACGVMITASHNPENDNGVKLVDPSGEMLDPVWEAHATRLAQAASDVELLAVLERVLEEFPPAPPASARVVVGRDTRASGERLAAACAAGVEALGVALTDVGIVTTPELHYSVMVANAYHALSPEQPYFTTLVESVRTLTVGRPPLGSPLYVDCANGVGALKLTAMAPALATLGIELVLVNAGEGRLNHLCGSDHVQKEQAMPAGFGDVPDGARCCSIDGDADRVVFFTQRSGRFVLMDGDRITSLAAMYLRKVLAALPGDLSSGITMGAVQTAYANGASTAFLRNKLRLPVTFTATGVKHLHHAAKAFDIGVYFESNGHGTVLFAPPLLERLQQRLDDAVPVVELLAVSRLMHQAVGDAIGGALFVEAVLRSGFSWQQWEDTYSDLPSRQTKVKVSDRTVITTTDAERRCVTPAGLQDAIDVAVARVPSGRAFARPSGTEDAVRVYAEAATQADADALADEVGRVVQQLAGGASA